jgi:hypothetical protein
MEVYGYGEDALTLWAIQNRLPAVLERLDDRSSAAACRVFFRPSFGRSGGPRSSQFGEFDFILLAERCLYLGESKWDRSAERIEEGVLALQPVQVMRHAVFRFYVEEWAFGTYASWGEFVRAGRAKLAERGIDKPLAPDGSLLADNLQTVLDVIGDHYGVLPEVQNVLLYLHAGVDEASLPREAADDFRLVPVDYSEGRYDNLIRIEL